MGGGIRHPHPRGHGRAVTFRETALQGVFIIEIDLREDARGWFARAFCISEFAAHGIDFPVAQCNLSFSKKRGTLRGMHYQAAPFAERKLVQCLHGAVYDVVLDLRPGSPTFGKWAAVTLTAENRRMHLLPEGCAHGFQTLEDKTTLFYWMSAPYAPESAEGVRWDDPAFGIAWPIPEKVISPKDRDYPLFQGTGC